MIEPQAGVARPAVAQIAPEGEHRLIRMQFTQRVGPAHVGQVGEGGARRRLQQRIIDEGARRINVEVGRHDIVVAGQHRRDVFVQQRRSMVEKTVEPVELVGKFRPRLWVAVRHVERGDHDAADGCLDVAALRILLIAGQRGADQHRLGVARQNGDAVPATLAAPHGAVASLAQRIDREGRVGGFQLLQAHHVRPLGGQPRQQIAEPLVDVVDIEGGDLHDLQRHLKTAEKERAARALHRAASFATAGCAGSVCRTNNAGPWEMFRCRSDGHLSVRSPEAIPDSGFGQHEARPLRIGLDLLPELPDIDAQILRVGDFVP